MDERPARLPFAATRVVKASRVLPWGAKAVWLEDWALDRGPEGAWISAGNLAARVGMSKENVERHRRRLLELGLYYVVRRTGARSDGWVPTLPPLCVPPTRPTPEHIMTGAAHLDQMLDGAAPSGVTDAAPGAAPMPPPVASPDMPPSPEARREGGRGEGSNLELRGRETTLQPHEDGEVARATTTKDGGETLDERRARFRHLLGSASREASRDD